jgi:signal transduction histidine kinase
MTHANGLQHTLTNYLAIILGFSELLLQELPASDPRRADLEEIHRAATAALQIVSAKEFGSA